MPLLSIKDVTRRFGGLTALSHATFDVLAGEIFALIGPNGAGKTTLFNLITGVYPPTSGAVFLGGEELTGLRPHEIARLGISRTFQNIRLFSYMSALDNVRVGFHSKIRLRLWDAILKTPAARRQEELVKEQSVELLRFVGLEAQAHSYARNLPYGQQRRLEIARALALDPRLLLLDEPAAGSNPREKMGLMELMREVRGRGITIFLIEHDMKVVMNTAEHVVVLDHGEMIADGSPSEVRSDPRVVEAYLGRGA